METLKNNPYIPVREQTLKNSPEDSESGKGDVKLCGAAPETESMAILGPEARVDLKHVVRENCLSVD